MAYSCAIRQSASLYLGGSSARRILPIWLYCCEPLETSLYHPVSLLIQGGRGEREFFTDSPSLHTKFSIKDMTHSIQKIWSWGKTSSKECLKLIIKTTPFTAVAKRWEESSNSNKEIIWQWIRIYSDSIQIYFDERECNFCCSCHIWGKYFIFSSSILLSLCSD